MSLFETLLTALSALARNTLRSALTALGIVIGVAAVIAMVAIGSGAQARVEAAFKAMGTNLLVLLPGSSRSGGVRGGFGSQPTITWADLKAIQTQLDSVKYVAPQLRSSVSLVAENGNWNTQVTGTTADYFALRDWPAEQGGLFTAADVEATRKVIVLGATAAENLFGNESAIGQIVRINNTPFEVLGVLKKKGQSAQGQDYDDAAFLPVTAYRTKINQGLANYVAGTVTVQAVDGRLDEAEQAVTDLLRERHKLDASKDNDFSIRNLTETAEAQQDSTRTLTTLLAAVAGVSLLVGGIGVMNIMLVSVTERTREIGLRMALGARPRDILGQFLSEAAMLSMLGGALGVALGVGAAGYLAKTFGWDLLIAPTVVIIAVSFSALVGVVFGLYPALQASRLDPITALRHE
jgi:putative ABC transport system permease protein